MEVKSILPQDVLSVIQTKVNSEMQAIVIESAKEFVGQMSVIIVCRANTHFAVAMEFEESGIKAIEEYKIHLAPSVLVKALVDLANEYTEYWSNHVDEYIQGLIDRQIEILNRVLT